MIVNRRDKGDMAQSVARNRMDVEPKAEYGDLIVVGQGDIPSGNLLIGWPIDRGAGRVFQLGDAAGMIGVMVCHQDVTQLPAGVVAQPGEDRCRVARIDDRAALAGIVL